MQGVPEITSSSLSALMQENPEAVRLIDVRSVGEMAQGMIPAGESMPLHLVPLRADEIINSDKPVVIYCRSGARSAQAVMFLLNRGADAQKIFNLRGGIIDWVRQGNQVVAPDRSALSA